MISYLSRCFKYFAISYVVFSFLELFLNREFLLGVLPLGYAGVDLSSSLPFLAVFYVGAFSFGMLFVLQFVVLFLAAVNGGVGRRTRGLLWSVLYLTALFDVVHVYLGVDNTAFNVPPLASLAYVVLIVGTAVAIALQGEGKTEKVVVLLLLVPDIDAYLVLVGSWLTQLTMSSAPDVIDVTAGSALAYLVLVSGSVFVAYSIWKGVDKRYLVLGLAVGVPVLVLSWFNLVPGLATAIGYTFPYILGILGVKDWMPPVFFFVAAVAFFSALGLYKKDPRTSLTALALFGGALIFDTVSSTTYMLIPLIAVLVGSLSKQVVKV